MFDSGLDFNRYTNLDGLEWRIVNFLVQSKSKHADRLWKMLKDPSEDCLSIPSISVEDRYEMIYQDNGLSTTKQVFLEPYLDDAWEEQASRLDVFVDRIFPKNHISSQVNVGIEILVHNKISNIRELVEEEAINPNPADYAGQGLIIPIKNRATCLLKSVLAELNGQMIAGVGQLQCNSSMNPFSGVQSQVWNNRAYFGYQVTMCTLLSGVSEDSNIGY